MSSLPISDYALIGNLRTAALVSRTGSIDWLCWPRFDSGACFAALVGHTENGYWSIGPAEKSIHLVRRYRPDTLILETEFATSTGRVRLVDFMPADPGRNEIVRIVEGLEGRVALRSELLIRFDYGAVVPWVQRVDGGITAIAGPDALRFVTPVASHGENFRTLVEFEVAAGERLPFVLSYFPSFETPPGHADPLQACEQTEQWWRNWCAQGSYDGAWQEAVRRSLITLKALSYAPTGGIVAAPTTSLPEHPGGVRNWDYRFCWLRDATFTLYAFLIAGYRDEAKAWRQWLLHAAAGRPSDLQIVYGIGGERRLTELELDWLVGYRDSRPVRIGNAAVGQFQLDVYGEVLDTLHLARRSGLATAEDAWRFQLALLRFLESAWEKEDNGIWEVRGPPQHFTFSKVMAWVGFDRAVKAVEHFRLRGPVEHWRRLRDLIHAEICRHGIDPQKGCFVQSFGGKTLDASLLLIPLVGFLPVNDERVRRTVEAIEQTLMADGFVLRYDTHTTEDGLPGGEGVFLPCSFWLADNYALMGRRSDAQAVFDRLLAVGNDVGLLAEEYDPINRELLGNFPQALTHVALVNTARNLLRSGGPAEARADDSADPVNRVPRRK
jgi:GH15 family glucan-1,4-alpha-glucosidase